MLIRVVKLDFRVDHSISKDNFSMSSVFYKGFSAFRFPSTTHTHIYEYLHNVTEICDASKWNEVNSTETRGETKQTEQNDTDIVYMKTMAIICQTH